MDTQLELPQDGSVCGAALARAGRRAHPLRPVSALVHAGRWSARLLLRAHEAGRRAGADHLWPVVGFCIDPSRKSRSTISFRAPAFSFGTAGCNLGCKFCQNWDISKAKE